MMGLRIAAMAVLLIAPARAAEDPNLSMAHVMAVAAFTEESCPKLKPNYNLITQAFVSLGLKQENMLREPYRSIVFTQVSKFQANPPFYCESFLTLFGPQGTVIPNLIEAK